MVRLISYRLIYVKVIMGRHEVVNRTHCLGLIVRFICLFSTSAQTLLTGPLKTFELGVYCISRKCPYLCMSASVITLRSVGT